MRSESMNYHWGVINKICRNRKDMIFISIFINKHDLSPYSFIVSSYLYLYMHVCIHLSLGVKLFTDLFLAYSICHERPSVLLFDGDTYTCQDVTNRFMQVRLAHVCRHRCHLFSHTDGFSLSHSSNLSFQHSYFSS
jgi:hypothetical protein